MQQAQVLSTDSAVDDLFARFGASAFVQQPTPDNTPTLWVAREQILDVLAHLKPRFPMLLDLFGMDERLREHKPAAASDFTVIYHLFNLAGREEIRLKVAVSDADQAETVLLRTLLEDPAIVVTDFRRREYQLEDVFVQVIEGGQHGGQ